MLKHHQCKGNKDSYMNVITIRLVRNAFMKIIPEFLNVNGNLTICLFFPVMTPEEAKRTQRPYRYGMLLLCFGALINWIGLAENYTEPIRYAGVACILSGAMLICTAMCCWLRSPGPEPVTRSFEVNIFMLLVKQNTFASMTQSVFLCFIYEASQTNFTKKHF